MQDVLAFSTMTDDELQGLLRTHKIGLTVSEARHICELLGRDPTLTEATVWGIQGSEHCSYKSSRKHLRQFPVNGSHVIVPVGEDSGVFSLIEHEDTHGARERYGVVVAHESHNHPSQVVPYEGAATGVGGIVRDIACMGGRVIGTMDGLRFGAIDRQVSQRIASGVVSGIGGYGNPIGVPNVGGDVFFHPSYNENCLVNVVAIGLVKESEVIHSHVPDEAAECGYEFIAVGKPTDRSGMGGAAFASASFDHAGARDDSAHGAMSDAGASDTSGGTDEDLASKKSAVQEPNPFLKRHLLVSTYDLFDELKRRGWLGKVAFKDLGAGGNVCSTVEMVAKKGFGAEIDLDKIHTALPDLPAAVIACSETQERFMWCCDPEISDFIVNHYNVKWNLPMVAENARASKIGKVVCGNYVLKYRGETVCDAKSEDITEGFLYDRPMKERTIGESEPSFAMPDGTALREIFLEMLGSEQIASRKPVYEKYDKQVQGYVVVERGEADGCVMAPFLDEDVLGEKRYTGLVSAISGNPFYGAIDAYAQGYNAVVNGVRKIASVGGWPLAVTDCLNYGNPEKEEQMMELVDGIRGIAEALTCVHVQGGSDAHANGRIIMRNEVLPVVSGNVSLYNEGASGSVAPSAVVAVFGKISDARKAVRMRIVSPESAVFLIGARKDECGGSMYYQALLRRGVITDFGVNVPRPDATIVEREVALMSDAVSKCVVSAAHVIDEGGLLVAAAEMCLGGRGDGKIGMDIDLARIGEDGGMLRADKKLFSETGGFLVEVPNAGRDAFLKLCALYSVDVSEIGKTSDDFALTVRGDDHMSDTSGDSVMFSFALSELSAVWTQGLREKLG